MGARNLIALLDLTCTTFRRGGMTSNLAVSPAPTHCKRNTLNSHPTLLCCQPSPLHRPHRQKNPHLVQKSENMIRMCDMDRYNPELPTIEVYAENYNIEGI